MSNIFLTIVVVLGIATLVCGLPLCCMDTYYRNKKRREAEAAYDNMDMPKEAELPEKILTFETAMKDITGTLNV